LATTAVLRSGRTGVTSESTTDQQAKPNRTNNSIWKKTFRMEKEGRVFLSRHGFQWKNTFWTEPSDKINVQCYFTILCS
jgi:hypothetical protein